MYREVKPILSRVCILSGVTERFGMITTTQIRQAVGESGLGCGRTRSLRSKSDVAVASKFFVFSV